MVNAEDLEEILGKRPWTSAELRNIDKYRDGFGGVADLVDDAPQPPPGQQPQRNDWSQILCMKTLCTNQRSPAQTALVLDSMTFSADCVTRGTPGLQQGLC